jgi:hypothetical protein
MPYVVLEAIAAGLPIVATRVGGIPEIFAAAEAELIEPGDPVALAAAIEQVLSDPERARSAASARREWIRARFSVDVMAERVEGLYRDILHRDVLSRPGEPHAADPRPAPLDRCHLGVPCPMGSCHGVKISCSGCSAAQSGALQTRDRP